MNDRSRFLSKSPPIHERADVKAFLNQFVETGQQVQEMQRIITEQGQEIASLKHKLTLDAQEIERLARERKEYLAAAGELRIQLETIVTSAVFSCDQATAACRAVVDNAKSALNATRDQMRRVNLQLPGDEKTDSGISDEHAVRFGEIFGANSRKDNEPLQS